MRSAVLADTGPLYAAVDPDDAYHPQAQRELKRLARNHHDVIIAYPTLLEAYTLVLYRLGRRPATNWLDNILAGAALVNPTVDDYHEAASRIQAFPDQPISLFDATLAVLAARLGVAVWTYDHHFDVMRVQVWR
jgi:predicted nucleic acid-binding protein